MINVGQAIAYLDLDTSRFRSQLSSVWNDFRQLTDSSQNLGDRISTLGGGLSKLGTNLTLGVTTPLVGFGVAATKVFGDFEAGINKISTLDTANKLNIPKLKDDILSLSDKIGVATGELNESVYSMGSAMGEVTQDTVKYVEVASKAAIAGFTDTNTAVDGLSTAMNIYGDKSVETMNLYADMMLNAQNLGKTTFGEMASSMGDILPIMSQLGLGMDIYSTSMAVLTKNGLQTSKATTGLKAAFSNIIKPTDDAIKVSQALGIEFNAAAVKSKGLLGFMKDVKSAMQQAAPEYVKISNSYSIVTSKMDAMEKAGKKSNKEYKELAKTKKALAKQMDLMAQAANSPIQGFAKLFGSVEALNTMMVLTSDQGMKDFDEILKTMPGSMGLVEEGFKKMDEGVKDTWEDTLVKMQNVAIKFGDIVAPTFSKVIEKFSSFLDWASNLDSNTKNLIVTVGGFAAALGPILFVTGKILAIGGSVISFVSTLGPMIASLGAVAAGTATPVGFLGTAVAALTGPVGIAIAGVAALGVAGVALYNHFSQKALPAVELFGEGVSQATKDATQGFLEMNNEVHKNLENLKINSEVVTREMATSISGNISSMAKQVITGLNQQREEAKNSITSLLTDVKDLQGQTSTEILAAIDADYNARQQKIQDSEANIKSILQTAANEQRELTTSEIQAINELRTNIAQEGIQVLTQSEMEQKVILEKMKENEGIISAEAAAESVKNAVEKKEKVVKEAEEQYEKTIGEIIKLRDESKVISEEQAKQLIAAAQKQKDESIKHAEDMHNNILTKAKAAAGQNIDIVNWETGTIKSKWDVFKEQVSANWELMGAKWRETWAKAGEEWAKFKERIAANWELIKAQFTEKIANLKAQFANFKADLVARVEEFKQNVIDKFNWLKGEIFNIFKNIKETITGKISEAKDSASKTASEFLNVGQDMINGMIQGIKNKAGELRAQAEQMARNAVDSVKRALGIKSPSRVFENEVGKQIVAGTAQGMTKNINILRNASDKVHKELLKTEKNNLINLNSQIEALDRKIKENKAIKRNKANREELNAMRAHLLEEKKLLEQQKKEMEAMNTTKYMQDTLISIHDKMTAAQKLHNKKMAKLNEDSTRESKARLKKYGLEEINSRYEELANLEKEKILTVSRQIEAIEKEIILNKSTVRTKANKDRLDQKAKVLEAEKKMLEQDKKNLTSYSDAFAKTFEKMQADYQKAFDAIESKQNSLAEKLKSFGKLMETIKTDDGKEILQLGDLRGQISTIKQYGDVLDGLKRRGADADVISHVLSMGVEEAVKYGNLLLQQSQSDFETYNKLMAEKRRVATEVASKAYATEFLKLKNEQGLRMLDLGITTEKQWGNIKTKMLTPMEQARKSINTTLKNIETSFKNMRLVIPKPKVPKIDVSYINRGGVSVPDYHVSWYDKGGVFYGPSIIGVGEKRPEFVGALEDLKTVVKSALNENGGKAVYQVTFTGNINVRNDNDIRMLSRELGDYILSQDRARGEI